MLSALVDAIKGHMERIRNKTKLSPREAAEKKKRLAERKKRGRYRWKMTIGLFGPFTLLALDSTVIATAFPYIATDFSTSHHTSRLCHGSTQAYG
jgi:hypothetical protein